MGGIKDMLSPPPPMSKHGRDTSPISRDFTPLQQTQGKEHSNQQMACEIEKLKTEMNDLKAPKNSTSSWTPTGNSSSGAKRRNSQTTASANVIIFSLPTCWNSVRYDTLQIGEKHLHGHHDGDQRRKVKRIRQLCIRNIHGFSKQTPEHSGNAVA